MKKGVGGAAVWIAGILTGVPSEGWTPSGCCLTGMSGLSSGSFSCNLLVRQSASIL